MDLTANWVSNPCGDPRSLKKGRVYISFTELSEHFKSFTFVFRTERSYIYNCQKGLEYNLYLKKGSKASQSI